jgi:glycosyltransferase involved in cell wall biosynthesis
MIEEFENCDCFVLPSRHESFGVVYVQAIACGKPIIATRCGGPEHIVTPENGLLVDIASPSQLAKALHDMFTFRDNYDAKLIRQQFLDRFSLPVVVNKIERVYRDVFGDGW